MPTRSVKAFPSVHVYQRDLLEWNGDLDKFDRIIMNPPFDHGADIKHVEHALEMLVEVGRLASIVANGPRQREKLEPIATPWIDLPVGTFAGTNVNAVIVVIDA